MESFSITPMVMVIPGLFLLVLLEGLVARWKGAKVYRFQDTITSINIGLLSQFVNATGAVISVFMYNAIETRYGSFGWQASNPFTWIFALLLYDFLYYWVHRTGHEVNLFWAAHITHHSSEEFNISTAMRQASTGFYFKWVFYIPLAILGIPLQIFIIIGLIDLLYQVWVHTQLVGRLGWLELFLVTPSNHRVHHGQNDYCIDRNYGGIFSVWDRFFGTYADERKEEPIVFGIRKPLGSWNPVWGNLHYYFTILTKVKSTPHWNEKLMAVFGDPAWVPSGKEAEQIPSPILETYEKLSLNSPWKIKFLGIFTTFSFALFLLFYLGTRNQMSFFLQVTWVAMAVLILGGIGSIWGSARYNSSKR